MRSEADRGSGNEAELRERLVASLVGNGTITSAAVGAAMRAVPRHVFVPEVDAEVAYDPFNAVVTKLDDHGNAVSSVSAPQVQAFMLEQSEIVAGIRVLEVGSGGYNAALLAELVGPAGQVTSVDIDGEVTDRARLLLDKAGYPQVQVLLADAEGGVPEHAPYDRILITAGAWDIPPAWVDQLADDGRLLVPLRMRGLTRTIAFERHPSDGEQAAGLVSRSSRLFGFVPVQGRGARAGTLVVARGGEVTLRFDDSHEVDPQLVEQALSGQRREDWTGIRIGRRESQDTLQLWLASVAPGFCTLTVDPARDTGLIATPGRRNFALAGVDGGCLAYLTTRATDDPDAVELGVHAMGFPAAQVGALAELLVGHLHVWNRQHRGGPGPQIRVYPAGTPDALLGAPAHVIDKRHSRVTISWPHAAPAAPGQVQHGPTSTKE